MKRNKKSGFSLLEVIAAVIILAVVAAATVATVAPMRAKSDEKLADQEVATLNSMTQTYYLEEGNFPASVDDLVTNGYMSNSTQAEIDRISKIKTSYRYRKNIGTFEKK